MPFPNANPFQGGIKRTRLFSIACGFNRGRNILYLQQSRGINDMLKLDTHPSGRHFLNVSGLSPVPACILRAKGSGVLAAQELLQ
jgi:hypothetical protein